VKVSGEDVRRVKAFGCQVAPVSLFENLGVDLALPEDREVLTLRVVFDAGQVDERLLSRRLPRWRDGINQIPAISNLYDLTKLGNGIPHRRW
jgi:hypothetical protein